MSVEFDDPEYVTRTHKEAQKKMGVMSSLMTHLRVFKRNRILQIVVLVVAVLAFAGLVLLLMEGFSTDIAFII